MNEHIKYVHGAGTYGCNECDNVIPSGYQTKNTWRRIMMREKDHGSNVIKRDDGRGDRMVVTMK